MERNNILFLPTPGASYQDTSFKFKTTSLAEKIVLTPNAYLNYRQDNTNSSVKITTTEKLLMVHTEYDEIKHFIETNNLPQFKRAYIIQRFKGYLWNYNRIHKSLTNEYFHIFRDDFINEIKSDASIFKEFISVWGILMYHALMSNNQFVFDICLKIHRRKERTLKSLLKRNYLKKEYDWL